MDAQIIQKALLGKGLKGNQLDYKLQRAQNEVFALNQWN